MPRLGDTVLVLVVVLSLSSPGQAVSFAASCLATAAQQVERVVDLADFSGRLRRWMGR